MTKNLKVSGSDHQFTVGLFSPMDFIVQNCWRNGTHDVKLFMS